MAGGYDTAARKTAALYDPATGTWTDTGNLNTENYYYSIILLPSGKVLVAGGYGGLNKAEIYDPATGTWTPTGNLNSARFSDGASLTTLLPNGKVLIAAGWLNTALDSAELFDPGLGFQEIWRPVIDTLQTSLPATPDNILTLGENLILGGNGFRGKSEASGGANNNSSTGYPLVQLLSVEGQRMHWLPPSAGSFSDTSFTSAPIWQFLPSGYYLTTVFTSGIPSLSQFVLFQNSNPTAIKLISFEAEPSINQIVLSWETATEKGTAGFHLWRAQAGTENYTRITEHLLPAEGTDTTGAFYEYTDATVTAGQSYSYKLQDVDLDGKSTFHGPVTATAGFLTLQAPNDGAAVSALRAPQFGWTSYPFDRFRLQFCKLDDFSGQVVELPLAVKGKITWLDKTSYTPTDKEWTAVKALVGRKGGVISWQVRGADGSQGSGTSEAWSFRVPAR